MALSKGIVELHHGQIEVQSAIDYGSIFTVILPKENLFKDDNDVTFIEATKAESATILAPFTETTETEECAETPEPILLSQIQTKMDLRGLMKYAKEKGKKVMELSEEERRSFIR